MAIGKVRGVRFPDSESTQFEFSTLMPKNSLPKDKALVYFDSATGLYARGTLSNFYGDEKFNWRPFEKLPERFQQKIALIQLLPAKEILDGIGMWRPSKHYTDIIQFQLYGESWKK